jgi:hypothetical protein
MTFWNLKDWNLQNNNGKWGVLVSFALLCRCCCRRTLVEDDRLLLHMEDAGQLFHLQPLSSPIYSLVFDVL